MKRNIIITGGELFNKGAQAMLFVTVDELKKRYPEHDILVYSPMDLQRDSSDLDKYAFSFIGWYPIKFARAQKNPLLHLSCFIRSKKELEECENIYKNCDLMIDISGYALGSCWSNAHCNNYLNNLEFAKCFNIPIYLMPQSFGPFDFNGKEGKKLFSRCKALLPYPKIIFAREESDLKELRNTFHLQNIKSGFDIVLNNKGISKDNIYRIIQRYDSAHIKENSVGIITNNRLLNFCNSEKLIQLYSEIINQLLSDGKHVYLVNHSANDKDLTKNIKCQFAEEDDIIELNGDYSCLELNEIVKGFDFLIASRFHSIVHAFKNDVPCIVIGWAEKYIHLMSDFDQTKYVFDIRNDIFSQDVLISISTLEENINCEKEKLKEILTIYQKDNVFDILPNRL